VGRLASYVENHCSRPVFLNRRDASRYRDLEAFLPGLELFLKLYNTLNSAFISYQFFNLLNWKCNSIKNLESCNTNVSLRKATTCRIKSHIRHIIYPILTVYDSMGIVVYQGFTVLYFGRGRSHTFAYTFLGFPPKFSCSQES
jgi:hypothetical protein